LGRIGCLFFLLILILGGGVAVDRGMGWWSGPGPLAQQTRLVLVPGGVEATGDQLAKAGVIRYPLIFALVAKATGDARHLKLGEYDFPAHVSPAGVIKLLLSGKTVKHKLVIPEGFSSAEVIAAVDAAPEMSGAAPRNLPEGAVLPETYIYSYGDSRAGMVARMERAMRQELDQLWADREPGLPLTSEAQAVTLASIVEKETGLPTERPKIAAVFYNRLKLGMKLQSDPTVIYAITKGDKPLGRPLDHDDLATASPYNTYASAGLPPGPIANPGKASLLAVLHPAHTKDLYFVADGTGGHAFAETLEAHNRNVVHLRESKAAASANGAAPAGTGGPAGATAPQPRH
jgi:UPF0755 protein